jgi:hypothetical protein
MASPSNSRCFLPPSPSEQASCKAQRRRVSRRPPRETLPPRFLPPRGPQHSPPSPCAHLGALRRLYPGSPARRAHPARDTGRVARAMHLSEPGQGRWRRPATRAALPTRVPALLLRPRPEETTGGPPRGPSLRIRFRRGLNSSGLAGGGPGPGSGPGGKQRRRPQPGPVA